MNPPSGGIADDATYALAWLPLHNPEAFPEVARERHARNM